MFKIVDVQGMHVQELTKNSKKTIAMVAMGLSNLHDVLGNVFMYATNEYSKLHIRLKKGEVKAVRRYKHLDLVVLWAFRDF